jgi:RNA polymerase sigma factor (sigma-70 family)
MTTATLSDSEDRRQALCDTTQKAVNVPVERFEFNDDYLARLRGRDLATWQHFDEFFRQRIRAKFRAKFSWELADDLAGATMLAVIESIDRGEPREAACLAGYVFSICHHKMLEAWRKFSKESPADFDFESLGAKEKTPLQECLGKEEAKKIQRVLGHLSKRDHDVLVSIYYHGQDRDQVCQRYGVERDHLKMILFHARKRFQKEWERD